MAATVSHWRLLAGQVLLGLGAGVGAYLLWAVTFSWMPGINHVTGHGTGPGDIVLYLLLALCLPLLGVGLGVVAGTACAEPRRRGGLWLGAALGLLLGLGLIGLAPFLSQSSSDQENLCSLAPLGCVVLGALLGVAAAWRAGENGRVRAGVAWGVGAGVLANGLLFLGGVPGISDTSDFGIPDWVFGGVYAFAALTLIGALFGVASRPAPRPLWLWAAAAVVVALGPAVGFVLQRIAPSVPPAGTQERVVIEARSDESGISFRHEYGNSSRSDWKAGGTAGAVFSATSYPYTTSVTLTWPRPGDPEIVVDFESNRRGLKVEAFNLSGAAVTCNEQATTLPVEVPPGKHRLVIRGR